MSEQYPTTRLSGEGAKPYQAFRLYVELGDKRTQRAVAKKLKKSCTIVGRWASAYHWTERIITHHGEEADRERAALEQAALEKARQRLERQNEVQDSAWELFKALREKVTDMLKFPVARQTVESKDGKTVTIVEPIRWRFSDVARVSEVADGLARLSTGMATSNGKLAISDPNGAPLPAPVQTLIQINISRAADAKSTHEYKTLKGDEEEDENAVALEA